MYCTNCNKEYEGKFCPECGTKLIEKPATGGFNISLGDANAISGGINLHHNVQNVDNSVHNITNNSSVVNNIVERQKTASEELQEKKLQFNLLLDEILADNVLTEEEKLILKNHQLQIGLDDATAQVLIDNARRRVRNNVRQESLGVAAGPVKQLTMLFLTNQTEKINAMIPRMAGLARNFKVDEVQHKYFVALAAMNPEELIRLDESDLSDNYWRSYWAYIAYRKLGKNDKAEDILWGLLPSFETYSAENITLLQCVSDIADFGESAAKDTLNTVTGNYSPELKLFANALYMRLDPELAAGFGANRVNCAFYDQNILTLETPQARKERIAKARAEQEAKARAEQEAKAKAEAEAKARAEAEAKAKMEAERKAHAQAEYEAAARKKLTHTLSITAIQNQLKGLMAARLALGWGSSDSRQKFAHLPVVALETEDKQKAISIYEKLVEADMAVTVKSVNGLGEIINDGLGLEKAAAEKARREAEAKANLEAEAKARREASIVSHINTRYSKIFEVEYDNVNQIDETINMLYHNAENKDSNSAESDMYRVLRIFCHNAIKLYDLKDVDAMLHILKYGCFDWQLPDQMVKLFLQAIRLECHLVELMKDESKENEVFSSVCGSRFSIAYDLIDHGVTSVNDIKHIMRYGTTNWQMPDTEVDIYKHTKDYIMWVTDKYSRDIYPELKKYADSFKREMGSFYSAKEKGIKSVSKMKSFMENTEEKFSIYDFLQKKGIWLID